MVPHPMSNLLMPGLSAASKPITDISFASVSLCEVMLKKQTFINWFPWGNDNAEQAWEAASAATIKNCWQHTGILHPWLPKITLKHPCPLMPANLEAGWDIVSQFAMEQWSISEVHTCLQEQLGDQYISNEWNKSLDSVLRTEDDTDAALAALDALCNQWAPNGSFELCEVATTTKEGWGGAPRVGCSTEGAEVHYWLAMHTWSTAGSRRVTNCRDPYEFRGRGAETIEVVQQEIGLAVVCRGSREGDHP